MLDLFIICNVLYFEHFVVVHYEALDRFVAWAIFLTWDVSIGDMLWRYVL